MRIHILSRYQPQWLCTIVCGINFLLYAHAPLSSAQDNIPSNIRTIAERITIRVVKYATLDEGVYINAGSATLQDRKGNTCTLVTVQHLLRSYNPEDITNSYFVILKPINDPFVGDPNPGASKFEMTRQGNPKVSGDDIATLKVKCDETIVPVRTVGASQLRDKDVLYISGFSLDGKNISSPLSIEVQKYNEAETSSGKNGLLVFDRSNKDRSLYGFSGGPIINQDGEIVAIHRQSTARSAATNQNARTGALPVEPPGRSNPSSIPPKSSNDRRSVNDQPVIRNQKPFTESDYNLGRGQRG